jgi:unsaturated rhamnogalacturonyl hydrolase
MKKISFGLLPLFFFSSLAWGQDVSPKVATDTPPTVRAEPVAEIPAAPAKTSAEVPAEAKSKLPGTEYLSSWPENASPRVIGRRVTERYLVTPYHNFGLAQPPGDIQYPDAVTWYGALKFSKLSGDKNLTVSLIKRFELLFGPEAKMIPKPVHVDAAVFGAVPLELYIQTGEERYLELGKKIADRQWEKPEGEAWDKLDPETRKNVEGGLSWHTRFWIDDMFMISLLQGQAYRATKDPVYIDRATLEMVAYLEKMQEPNGLFYHSPGVPFFWGRGDGWMAAGMSELLQSVPPTHSRYAPIMKGYQKMMASLLKYQDEKGMWHQLVDDSNAWPETSCTAMFTYAFITGVKNGWLDPEQYGPAARKGWLALVSYLDDKAQLKEICIGTNIKNDRDHYLNRPRRTGDMHGQAPMLWCAAALLE